MPCYRALSDNCIENKTFVFKNDRSTDDRQDQAGHCPLTGRYFQPCKYIFFISLIYLYILYIYLIHLFIIFTIRHPPSSMHEQSEANVAFCAKRETSATREKRGGEKYKAPVTKCSSHVYYMNVALQLVN